MPILPTLQGPADLRGLTEAQLEQLAAEIRETIIATVASDRRPPRVVARRRRADDRAPSAARVAARPDRLGHRPPGLPAQAPDRPLRAVRDAAPARRRRRLPASLASREHDVFDGGHAGTGLSIAEGLATARDLRHGLERIAVVVGDAALMSGLALEALNDIGQRQTQMLIVLNDNEMSISPTVGALSKYLSQIKLSRHVAVEQDAPTTSSSGGSRWSARRVLELSASGCAQSVVNFAQPGQLFEDLGITYIGRRARPRPPRAARRRSAGRSSCKGPVIVHVRTQKGRGFKPAETDQVGFHGAALPPMTRPGAGNGNGATTAAGAPATPARCRPSRWPTTPRRRRAVAARPKKHPNYTAVFAAELIELARTDRRIVGITAGHADRHRACRSSRPSSRTGSFDVGIAEQHSMALATGLAMGGMRPVVALYSTFLQRAFDQTVHDVCQNDQPVLIAVDRAGLVGEDGTSHQGMFTLPAQRQLPNLVIASPEGRAGAALAAPDRARPGPPVRAPLPARRRASAWPPVEPTVLPIGQGEVLREGSDLLFVGFGPIVARAIEAADALAAEGWSVGVINARFAKPLDRELILDQARGKRLVVTFEESVVTGGFGCGVLEAIEEARLADPAYRDVPVRIIGIPGDRFVDHGSVADLRRVLRLDGAGPGRPGARDARAARRRRAERSDRRRGRRRLDVATPATGRRR